MSVDLAWLLEGPLGLLRFTKGRTSSLLTLVRQGPLPGRWIRAVPWGPHVGPPSVSAPIQLRKAKHLDSAPKEKWMKENSTSPREGAHPESPRAAQPAAWLLQTT